MTAGGSHLVDLGPRLCTNPEANKTHPGAKGLASRNPKGPSAWFRIFRHAGDCSDRAVSPCGGGFRPLKLGAHRSPGLRPVVKGLSTSCLKVVELGF